MVTNALRTDSRVVHQCDLPPPFFREDEHSPKLEKEKGDEMKEKRRGGRPKGDTGWGRDSKKAISNIEKRCFISLMS